MNVFLLLSLLWTGSSERLGDNNLRATWVPTSWGCTTDNECDQTFATLKAQGVERVYLDVWNNGLAYFYSPTMLSLVGEDGLGPDHLAWGQNAAQKHGLELYAWFEYGFMSAYGNASANAFSRRAEELGWTSGYYESWTWLNPSITAVYSFLGQMMADAVKNYEIDGVQLDDHFAWHTALGGFTQESMQVMTTAATYISELISPLTQNSLSPYPNPANSASLYNVNWIDWQTKKLFDEWVPQWYTYTFSSYESNVLKTMNETVPSEAKNTIAGIRCNGAELTAWDELEQMIEWTAQQGYGQCVWYGACIVEPDMYYSQFQQLWGGLQSDSTAEAVMKKVVN